MTQFFRSVYKEKKLTHILTLKVESLAELKFDPTFYVQMTEFFAQCTDRKN